jgi:hypothetical protein
MTVELKVRPVPALMRWLIEPTPWLSPLLTKQKV